MTTATKTADLKTAEIGDGATENRWTDRKAATIIARTAKSITVQLDKQTLLNGATSGAEDALEFAPGGFCGHTSGAQRYAYERDEDGATATYTLRKNGRWVKAGQAQDGQSLSAGRNGFYDFNF